MIPVRINSLARSVSWMTVTSAHKIKVKDADLYSAFIEVLYTQGTQVRITQCYLQTTPYLPLPRKHSPDGVAHPRLRLRTYNCSLLLIYLPRKDERLSWPGWLVMQWDSLPARRQSPIPVLTGLDVEQLRWSRPTRDRDQRVTTTPNRQPYSRYSMIFPASHVVIQALVLAI